MSATERTIAQIRISWDWGTAYDFFTSLAVLQEPKRFGIRSAWASGMRARLQCEDREVLDAALAVIGIPAKWIHSLSQPKDVDHCLAALSQIQAQDRLSALVCCPDQDDERSPRQHLLSSVAQKGSWNEADLEVMRTSRPATS